MTHNEGEILLNVAIIGAGKYTARVAMVDGLKLFNVLTGREVTEEVIQALGLRRAS